MVWRGEKKHGEKCKKNFSSRKTKETWFAGSIALRWLGQLFLNFTRYHLFTSRAGDGDLKKSRGAFYAFQCWIGALIHRPVYFYYFYTIFYFRDLFAIWSVHENE